MTTFEPSLTEWVVLALLAEEDSHGFALAKKVEAGSDLARIITIRRPLVYRALDRLVASDLAEPQHIEPGNAGPTRTVHGLTRSGCEAVDRWLGTPVDHVRDLRIEFLVKVRLGERRGIDVGPLVAAQREALGPALANLRRPRSTPDVVDRWRHHNADAVEAFLREIG